MIWIKICGITNFADAQAAASLGADALGFIFAKSPRWVQPEKVREIVLSLPPETEKIGVFMDEKPEKAREIAEFCGLTGLQFHGNESPEYCKKFKDYQVIKAFRVNSEKGWDKIFPYVQNNAIDRILLDTYVKGVPGGTGKTFPWKMVASRNWKDIPVIVAGGINPLNVTSCLQEANPFGIDIGSGVEREPGKKDHSMLKELFEKVRGIKYSSS